MSLVDSFTSIIIAKLLPFEVFRCGIVPLLSFRDLQVLDSACTNRYIRLQLLNLWKCCDYAGLDGVKLVYSDVRWLCSKGFCISCLSLLNPCSDVLALLSTHAPELKKLTITNTIYVYDQVYTFLRDCREIQVFQIHFGNVNDADVFEIARNCRQLHTINLSSTSITDAAIDSLCCNCPLLLHVSLAHCRRLTDSSVHALTTTYPHLQSIDLNGCRELTDNSLVSIATQCQDLTSVIIGDMISITSRGLAVLFSSLPYLTAIGVGACMCVSDDIIMLLLQCCMKLECLNLYYCFGISDAAVIAVTECCPQLVSLDIFFISGLTDAALITIGQRCHALKCINISTLGISSVGISALAVGCPLLQEFISQELSITDDDVITLTRGCRDLRNINLDYCTSLSHRTICEIGEYCPFLSSLSILGWKFLNDFCVTCIVKHCSNLTVLRLSTDRSECSHEAIRILNNFYRNWHISNF